MDINAIKQRLDSLQNKNKPKKFEKVDTKKFFWKPSIGKQQIRIVPSKNNAKFPFKEVFVHYGITNYPLLALTNWGEKDPIVEFAQKLIKSGDKENWKMGKKLEPKMRVYVPVIVRGEEDKGVRLWEFGKEIYQELLSIAEDEDIGDYTSITNGRDITVDTVGPEATGTKYNKSSVRVKPKETPISEDPKFIEKVLNEQPDVLSIYQKKPFEDMKTLLQDYLTPEVEEGTEAEVEETESTEEGSEAFHATPQVNVKKSNAAAFDDLFAGQKK